jgi:hypothetical protein
MARDQCPGGTAILPRVTLWQSKCPPEPALGEKGADRHVVQKEIIKHVVLIACGKGRMQGGISFMAVPRPSSPSGEPHPLSPALTLSLVPRINCSSRASRVKVSDRWQQSRKAATQTGPWRTYLVLSTQDSPTGLSRNPASQHLRSRSELNLFTVGPSSRRKQGWVVRT